MSREMFTFVNITLKGLIFQCCKNAENAVIQLTQILDDEEPLLVVNQFCQLVRNAFAPPDGVAADQDGVVPRRRPHDADLLVRGLGLQRAGRVWNHRLVEIAVQGCFRQPRGRRSAPVDSHSRYFDLKS